MSADYWIGDEVEVIDLKEVGTYEGSTDNGLIRVNVKGQIIETSIANTRPFELPKTPKRIKLSSLEKDVAPFEIFLSEIDLHIEILAPEQLDGNPLSIQIKQRAACKQFLKQCVQRKVPYAKIIHGKGSGVLKSIVLDELSSVSTVFMHKAIHDGGGIEIFFNHK